MVNRHENLNPQGSRILDPSVADVDRKAREGARNEKLRAEKLRAHARELRLNDEDRPEKRGLGTRIKSIAGVVALGALSMFAVEAVTDNPGAEFECVTVNPDSGIGGVIPSTLPAANRLYEQTGFGGTLDGAIDRLDVIADDLRADQAAEFCVADTGGAVARMYRNIDPDSGFGTTLHISDVQDS